MYPTEMVAPMKAELVDAGYKELLSVAEVTDCLLYTSPSPRDRSLSRMPSSA